mmetsp:Transcript_57379/g.134498  ORF Transcript_57379/g.134498 Transcript_57379/m.134498 type:complete len:270 (-) Transcript_57379:1146-1955(-)
MKSIRRLPGSSHMDNMMRGKEITRGAHLPQCRMCSPSNQAQSKSPLRGCCRSSAGRRCCRCSPSKFLYRYHPGTCLWVRYTATAPSCRVGSGYKSRTRPVQGVDVATPQGDRLMMMPPSPALSGRTIHAAILSAHARQIQRLKIVPRGQPWKTCYGQSRRASPSRRCHQRTSEGAHEIHETGQLRDCAEGPKEPRRFIPRVMGRKLRRSSRPWRWPRPRSRGRAPCRSRRSERNEAGQQTLLQSFVLLRFAPVRLRRRAHRKAAGEPHF